MKQRNLKEARNKALCLSEAGEGDRDAAPDLSERDLSTRAEGKSFVNVF